jgi:hypothetical protein
VVRFRLDGPDAELFSSSAGSDASRAATTGHDPGGAPSYAGPGAHAPGTGSEEGRSQEVEREEGAGAESGQEVRPQGGKEISPEGGKEISPEGGKVAGQAEADGEEARAQSGGQEDGQEEAAFARGRQAQAGKEKGRAPAAVSGHVFETAGAPVFRGALLCQRVSAPMSQKTPTSMLSQPAPIPIRRPIAMERSAARRMASAATSAKRDMPSVTPNPNVPR